jgi:hypothetical protein
MLLVVVSMLVLMGFAALTIDMGQMYRARAELQRAADAAALAGASAYYTENGYTQEDLAALGSDVRERAFQISRMNPTLGAPTIAEPSDIVMGTFDRENRNAPLDTSGFLHFNAVRVTLRREPGRSNGGVEFFFAPVLGIKEGTVRASATAIADDRVAGFKISEMKLHAVLPITIRAELYNSMLTTGPDQYSYDGGIYQGGVMAMADGIREVNIYPNKVKVGSKDATPSNPLELSGAGNFGTLNIGIDNLGNVSIIDQIVSGITADQLQSEIGSDELRYYDDAGQAVTHQITGNTGLSATLATYLAGRIGDLVGFFIHSDVTLSGSNADFTTVGLRFGRLMAVDLSGSADQKRVVIQPVQYLDSSVIVRENVPPTGGQVGRVVLVQ